MPVDRKLLQEPFYGDALPPWRCSTCDLGHLTLLERFPIARYPCGTYRRSLSANLDTIEDDYGVFTAIAKCSHGACQEAFAISGRYRSEMAFDDRGHELDVPACSVASITPPLRPIRIPAQCPGKVLGQLTASFSIMWQDANASLNRVRTALEFLIDHFGVPRTQVRQKKNGVRKRARLELHNRIERLGQKRKSIVDLVPSLLAVKYLGNDGTHDASATFDDLADALDLTEALLSRLFDPDHISAERITREVLKRKGRRRRKNP